MSTTATFTQIMSSMQSILGQIAGLGMLPSNPDNPGMLPPNPYFGLPLDQNANYPFRSNFENKDKNQINGSNMRIPEDKIIKLVENDKQVDKLTEKSSELPKTAESDEKTKIKTEPNIEQKSALQNNGNTNKNDEKISVKKEFEEFRKVKLEPGDLHGMPMQPYGPGFMPFVPFNCSFLIKIFTILAFF